MKDRTDVRGLEKRKFFPEFRATKIVATLGPASSDAKILRRMMIAGMDVARLNLSHGSPDDHQKLVAIVREQSAQLGKHIAVLADVPGQKIRITKLPTDILDVQTGEEIILTTSHAGDINKQNKEASIIHIGPPEYLADIKPKDTILLKDGIVALSVTSVGDEIHTKVTQGGTLTPGAGVVFPSKKRTVPFINTNFTHACLFAASLNPDYLALSFVESGEDIKAARELLQTHKYDIPIIAKIESFEAVRNVDEIIGEVDGIMVARGDLGVAMPLEQIPHIQKELIKKATVRGIPVITATEMLESMIHKNRPTRAEVTDVANAILDGTDCVMLSAETSIGADPMQVIRVMATIINETEKHLPLNEKPVRITDYMNVSALVSHAARTIADLTAVAIVAYTRSGMTARTISHDRPRVPIITITPNNTIARRVLLYRGVFPFPSTSPEVTTYEELLSTARELIQKTGIGEKGEHVVVLSGNTRGEMGQTNTIKVLKIDLSVNYDLTRNILD
jgi:pyruvate kinase